MAVQTKGGKAFAGLVTYLGLTMLEKDVQIFTVSSPDAYGEYKPYHFVSSEKEFISRVLDV